MKISHEVPRCLLTSSHEYNDFSYCLPHLLDIDEEYRNFFYEEKRKGRYVIMDNSLHELGAAYDHQRLLYWVNELEPDEFIVPDVWMNCLKTAEQAKHWLSYNFPKKTKRIAVIQGKNINQAYICANTLANLGYDKLCVSYGATWYNTLFPHTNMDMGKALGRAQFVQGLLRLDHLKDIKLHLLGTSIPQEFGWYDNHPQIESIDTSNPIMSALEGVKYNTNGLNIKPKANMNDHFNVDFLDINYDLIIYNTMKFRTINNLKRKY